MKGVCIGPTVLAALLMLIMAVLSRLNKHLPRFFCDVFGWHVQPGLVTFDGINHGGFCDRCGRHVILWKGDWIKAED